ncbi:MAG: DM13 domain-containing protein [Chloroflexota bacterium]|nr:DM13 domain-containing protein [Chloroflexota bacterium]
MHRLLRWLFTTGKGRAALGVLALLLGLGGWLAWWLASPLFLDTVVDEEFPLAGSAQIEGMTLSPDDVREMTRGAPGAETDAIIDRMGGAADPSARMPVTMEDAESIMQARSGVEERASEAMPGEQGAAVAVLHGEFRDADSFHKGSGTATVYRLPDGAHVLRFEEFSVTNGPDLRVLLSAHPDPETSAQVKDGGYVELARLKGNLGNQNYELPAGVDAAAYRSVVIYCRPFSVVFSVAPLSEPSA